jgi:hypothetical protein
MGGKHLTNCDIERCPCCGEQLLSCDHADGIEVTDDDGNPLSDDERISRAAYEVYIHEYYADRDRNDCTPVCYGEFCDNEWQDDECRAYYTKKITESGSAM